MVSRSVWFWSLSLSVIAAGLGLVKRRWSLDRGVVASGSKLAHFHLSNIPNPTAKVKVDTMRKAKKPTKVRRQGRKVSRCSQERPESLQISFFLQPFSGDFVKRFKRRPPWFCYGLGLVKVELPSLFICRCSLDRLSGLGYCRWSRLCFGCGESDACPSRRMHSPTASTSSAGLLQFGFVQSRPPWSLLVLRFGDNRKGFCFFAVLGFAVGQENESVASQGAFINFREIGFALFGGK